MPIPRATNETPMGTATAEDQPLMTTKINQNLPGGAHPLHSLTVHPHPLSRTRNASGNEGPHSIITVGRIVAGVNVPILPGATARVPASRGSITPLDPMGTGPGITANQRISTIPLPASLTPCTGDLSAPDPPQPGRSAGTPLGPSLPQSPVFGGVGVVPRIMIMHLSAPSPTSINDGISKEQFSLHYSTIDDAIQLITVAGVGAYLTNID